MSKLEVDAIEPQSGTTLTIGASGDTVNIASGATITDFTSTGIDDNATSTAITIDSSERVGIGETSPDSGLHITQDVNPVLKLDRGSANSTNLNLNYNGTLTGQISTGSNSFEVSAVGASTPTKFFVNGAERMRIYNDGVIGCGNPIGGTGSEGNSGTDGIAFACTSGSYVQISKTNGVPLGVNRGGGSNGTVISIRGGGNGGGTERGTISISAETVSYNAFTGSHWSRFTDNSKPNILRGTVLESLDEMCDWYNLEFDVVTQDDDGNDVTTPQKIPHVLTDSQSNGDVITYNHEGTDYQATIVKETDIKHMMSKVSDTVDAKNVYGVFNSWDEDGEGYNDFYVASVGSFVVRIKANETIAKGDLLQSNGDGTAKVQTDDAVRSSSFAKVLSTTVIETYDDGSYLVPCSLMC